MSNQQSKPIAKGRRAIYIVLGSLAALALLIVAVLNRSDLFGGMAAPTIEIIQPGSGTQVASGEGLVLLVEVGPAQAVNSIALLADGIPLQQKQISGQGLVQALFAWFGGSPGNRNLQVVAYDQNGEALASASLAVEVVGLDREALVEDAVILAAEEDPAADQQQAQRAAAAGLPADGSPPAEPNEADQAAPGDENAAAEDVEAQEAAEDEGEPAEDAAVAEDAQIEDNTPPGAELIVNIDRTPAGLVAAITANGADDVALDFLRLSISGPAGENQVFIAPCDERAVCNADFTYALGSSGEWVFHLQAFDLVPQASEPELTTRQILCEGAGAGDDCSIVERRDPLADILEAILDVQGELWDTLVSGDILDFEDIMADFALDGIGQPDQARDESFEVRGCLIIVPLPPESPPAPPVTECPEYNLSGEDLSGLDLRGADFERADLRQADLSTARLAWARLFATDLRGANLSNAQLDRIEGRLGLFNGATLSGASMDSAFLSGALMQDIRSAHIWLRGAMMVETDLSNAELVAANLNSANLSRANLSGANLQNATLVGAKLEGANLLGADLTGADFSNANLFRANFRPEAGQLPAGLWNGIVWNNTICPDGTNSDDNGGACAVANLAPFAIKGCVIVIDNQYPQPPFSNCSGLDMTAADFQGRDLRGADFTGTTLIAATMRDADFRFADFTNANLLGAHTLGGIFGNATWDNTICPDGSNSDDHNNTCEGFMFP